MAFVFNNTCQIIPCTYFTSECIHIVDTTPLVLHVSWLEKDIFFLILIRSEAALFFM